MIALRELTEYGRSFIFNAINGSRKESKRILFDTFKEASGLDITMDNFLRLCKEAHENPEMNPMYIRRREVARRREMSVV